MFLLTSLVDICFRPFHPSHRAMADGNQPKKRPRNDVYEDLMQLGRSSHVSKRGIQALLHDVASMNIEGVVNRRSLYRARQHQCYKDTPYGKLLEKREFTIVDGGKPQVLTIAFTNPLAMLHEQCSRSADFSKLVEEANARNPCSVARPWTIVFYQDGVNPGDGLSKNQRRKSSVFYFSFLELGMRALAHEEAWVTLAVVREDMVRKLPDGNATLASECLDAFYNPKHDISRSGCNVTLSNGTRIRIVARVGIILADALAFKEILACKGHGGHKPCFLCMNCTHHKPAGGGVPFHEVQPWCKPLYETDFNKFVKYDASIPAQSIRGTVRQLHCYKATLSNDEFDDKAMQFGWLFAPTGMIMQDRFGLAIERCTMFDWAHVYVCDGVLTDEVGMCMQVFRHARDRQTSWEELGVYAAKFSVPCGRNVTSLFTDKKIRSHVAAHSFSSTASELLTLVPILLRYFQHVVLPRGRHLNACRSLMACLRVVMILQACKCGAVTPDVLQDAITTHMQLFIIAYGSDAVKPKHHYALHLPAMLGHFGCLITTFVNERKHRMVKRYTRGRTVLQSWECGVLEEVISHHLWEIGRPFYNTDDVSKPHPRQMYALNELFPGVPYDDFTLHTHLKLHGGTTRKGDVVSFEADGEVEIGALHITVEARIGNDAMTYALVSPYRLVATDADHSARTYAVTDEVKPIRVDQLDALFTHVMSDDGRNCSILVPFELRPREYWQ